AVDEAKLVVLLKDRKCAIIARRAAAVPRDVFDRRRPVAHIKPTRVFTLLSLSQQILKRPELPADVIENAVENHLHSLLVRLGDEVEKQFVRSGPSPRPRII